MKLLKNLITKNGVYALILLWAVLCFTFFQGWYHYHFFYQEQNQLFLWSPDYLYTYLQHPAWLACTARAGCVRHIICAAGTAGSP